MGWLWQKLDKIAKTDLKWLGKKLPACYSEACDQPGSDSGPAYSWTCITVKGNDKVWPY